jgi:AcrR family transcriptional regulator
MAQQRGEETRSHILDVAGELFAERGYDATSVAGICARAGVTKGAFYHHFKSKQAVFLELRDRWLVKW